MKMMREHPGGNPADEQLLIEAAQKDPNRFAEIYENHFHRIYAFILRRVSNRDDAQDLTSQVFHHALANLNRYEWRGVPFAAWLYRIASNAISDHFRQSAREQAIGDTDPPEEKQDDIESRAMLFDMVDQLPKDQGRVVRMRFAEQMSIREIAEELQRSEGAVKQLQFRALETLRAQMRDSDG